MFCSAQRERKKKKRAVAAELDGVLKEKFKGERKTEREKRLSHCEEMGH